MFVFSALYRYRIPLLLLSLWMTAVFLLGDRPADSHNALISNWANPVSTVIAQKTQPLKVTDNVNKTLLENGLTVLTKEVHTAPVVSVQVWYKVGSRNEEPGVNGIAHQLEHMMFKGTKTRPTQFGNLFSALGSDSNAFTSHDQTAYYSTAERNKLKALLVLEADRMQNSLINAEQLASEKRVVISELQGYENSPEYRLNRAVMQAAFPNSVYGLPVGGTKADVEQFQVEQVQNYYRQFYTPDHAVLVIVGDFSTAKTLAMVKEVFGGIENREQRTLNREQVKPLSTEQSAKKTPIVLREPGAGAALLQMVYPLVDVNHPHVPALDVLDYILTEGRNSRLYQELVESGLASEVSAHVTSLRETGWYELLVTTDKQKNLSKIHSIIDHAIANLIKNSVTPAELNRAKIQLEASVILTNRDVTNQAMQLGYDETTAGDYRYRERYIAAIRQVKAEDVVNVAKKYLHKSAQVLGLFEPTQKRVKAATIKPHSIQTTESFAGSGNINLDEVLKYLPPIDETTQTSSQNLPQQFTLDNGLQVLLLPDKSTPTITLGGYIKAGTEFDPDEKAGLASLVAENLTSGTKTKDVMTLAKALEERGANLEFTAYREGMRIEGDGLAADLPVLLETLADVVKNSTFPKKELELNRQQALTNLKIELTEPEEVAIRAFVQSVYPKKHPLHAFPTEASLKQIKREDVIAFKAQHYRPDSTVLVIVGDFETEKVRSLIQAEFSDWQSSGQTPSLQYPTVPKPDKLVRLNPVLPGKAQAVTYMGYTGINRLDPRFYAASVMNQILGGDTLSSRLGSEIRDRQGLTYGIYSNFQAGKNYGTFLIELQTSPEDTTKAIASTQELLKQIQQHGVTPQEVESAKRTLISNYNVSLANPEELTKRILLNHAYGLDTSELRNFTERIQQVSLEQVNQAARELLHPDKIVVVTAGPSTVAGQ